MATFAPDLPATNDPNYIGWSKGSSPPKLQSTLGKALDTTGDVLEQGSKLANQTVENVALDETKKAIEPLAQQRMTNLESLVNPTTEQPLPEGAQRSLQQVDNLKSAMDSGKYTDVYTTGQMYAKLKELRAKYPSYADQIDRKASSITGFDIANKYYENMVQAFNERVSGPKERMNKALSMFDEQVMQQIPGAAIQRQQFLQDVQQHGLESAENRAMLWMNNANKNKTQMQDLETQAKQLEVAGKSRDWQDRNMNESMNTIFRSAANNYYFNLTNTPSGMTGSQIAEKLRAGVDPQVAQEYSQMLASNGAAMKNDMLKEANIPRAQFGGKSMIQVFGPGKVNQAIEENSAPTSWIQDLIHNKDWGVVHSAANMSNIITDQDSRKLLDVPEIRQYRAILKSIDNPAITEQVMKQATLDNVLPKVRGILTDATVGAATGAIGTDGKPTTLTSTLNKLHTNHLDDPVAADNLINNYHIMTNQQTAPEHKQNIARWFYNEDNMDLIKKIEEKGQYKFFNTLFQPNVTSEISKMPSDIQDMYRKSSENAFSYLFRKDLSDLEKYRAGSEVAVKWNAEHNEFFAEPRYNPNIPQGQQGAIKYKYLEAQKITDRINRGLDNMDSIYRNGGADPKTETLKLLKEVSDDPDITVASDILKSVQAERAKKREKIYAPFLPKYQNKVGSE